MFHAFGNQACTSASIAALAVSTILPARASALVTRAVMKTLE
jgi:hypothetical protein